jgi:hypothetical protein
MLEPVPQMPAVVQNNETVAVIADALAQKFGADALKIAQVQAACSGQETAANWLAVVELLR